MNTANNQPTHERAELQTARKALTLIHNLLAGPERMWEESTQYIRKWKDEDHATYEIRRKAEPLFGGLKRTLLAAKGMLHAKPMGVEWNESETVLGPLFDDIDNSGTNLETFCQHFSFAALRDGLAVLVVDFPTPPEGVPVTAANERQLGLRPYFTLYNRMEAVSWREAKVNGKRMIVQLTLRETASVPDGEFGVATVERYRDWRMDGLDTIAPYATWRLWEASNKGNHATEYVVTESGIVRNRVGETLPELPIAIAYTGMKTAALVVDPPLDGVAYANLAEWRYATNLAFNRELCGFEQLVITGRIAKDPTTPTMPGGIKVGPAVFIHLDEGSTAQWIAPGGGGNAQLEKGRAEKIEEMNTLGLGFLIPDASVQKTATEAHIDSYAMTASLAASGIAISDALNKGAELLAWYEGIEKESAPVITIQTDFDSKEMDSNTMLAYGKLVEAGFPKLQVLMQMQKGKRITADADLEELMAEWDGELAAQAAEADAQREAALATAAASEPHANDNAVAPEPMP